MAVTAADVLVYGPEFKDIEVGAIERALADAGNEVKSTIWGTRFDLALTLWACHLLAVMYPGTVYVPPQTTSLNGVSQTVPGTPSKYDRWETQYRAMLRTFGSGISVA